MQRAAVSLRNVLDVLEPERTEKDRFCGQSLNLGWGYLFGGQIVAQALAVAELTVQEDRTAHSLHGYFLRPGDDRKPVTYQLQRVRDGKSFATRRVDAIQDGRAIFTMTASFQCEEDAFEHQDLKPPAPGPEELLSQAEIARKCMDRMPDAASDQLSFEHAIEIRPVDPFDILNPVAMPPNCRVWYRTLGALPDRPSLHRHLLAFVSDLHLLSAAMRPHALIWNTPGLHTASLDHSIWFHRPFRLDEWLLYAIDSPSASGARGFTRGQFFTQDGRLVASTTQEALMRLRT